MKKINENNQETRLTRGVPPAQPEERKGGFLRGLASALFDTREEALRKQAQQQNERHAPSGGFTRADVMDICFGRPRGGVISGGTASARFSILSSIIDTALKQWGAPVIYVHCGNGSAKERYGSSARLPGGIMGTYCPLLGADSASAAEMLGELARGSSGEQGVTEFMLLICDILLELKPKLSLSDIVSFPCYDVPAFIIGRSELGARQSEFLKRYQAVSSGFSGARLLLSRLAQSPVFDCGEPYLSLGDVIEKGGLVCCDIVTDRNDVYKELVFLEIDRHLRKGERFALVVDGVGLTGRDGSATDAILKSGKHTVPMIIACEDLLVSARGDENAFQAIAGGNGSAFTLRHASATSSKMWENYFGSYYHKRADVSVNTAKQKWSFEETHTGGVNISEERRAQIPAEMITGLASNEAVVRAPDGRTFQIKL